MECLVQSGLAKEIIYNMNMRGHIDALFITPLGTFGNCSETNCNNPPFFIFYQKFHTPGGMQEDIEIRCCEHALPTWTEIYLNKGE